MFQLSSSLVELQLQHRHNDGSWSELERVDHDVTAHDPEREWADGVLYRCPVCEEEVRIKPGPGGLPADER